MLKKLISPLTQFKYFTFWVYMLTPRCCRFHICCNYFESSEKLFPLLITSPVPPLLDPIYYHIQVTLIIESFIMNHVYFSYCGYFHVREQFVQYKEEALKKNNNKFSVGGRCKRKGDMYIYGWFMLIYGRNQHNSIKQLSFT